MSIIAHKCPINNMTRCTCNDYYESNIAIDLNNTKVYCFKWSVITRKSININYPKLRTCFLMSFHTKLYVTGPIVVIDSPLPAVPPQHDDVIKWQNFPRYWPFVRRTVTGGFLSQRPVTRSFDDFFDQRLNKRLSKQSRRRWFETSSRSLWRHCNGKGNSHSTATKFEQVIFPSIPNSMNIIFNSCTPVIHFVGMYVTH